MIIDTIYDTSVDHRQDGRYILVKFSPQVVRLPGSKSLASVCCTNCCWSCSIELSLSESLKSAAAAAPNSASDEASLLLLSGVSTLNNFAGLRAATQFRRFVLPVGGGFSWWCRFSAVGCVPACHHLADLSWRSRQPRHEYFVSTTADVAAAVLLVEGSIHSSVAQRGCSDSNTACWLKPIASRSCSICRFNLYRSPFVTHSIFLCWEWKSSEKRWKGTRKQQCQFLFSTRLLPFSYNLFSVHRRARLGAPRFANRPPTVSTTKSPAEIVTSVSWLAVELGPWPLTTS